MLSSQSEHYSFIVDPSFLIVMRSKEMTKRKRISFPELKGVLRRYIVAVETCCVCQLSEEVDCVKSIHLIH